MRLWGGAGVCVDVRLRAAYECLCRWVCVCVLSVRSGCELVLVVHQGDTTGEELHLTPRKKVGKQDATLTQETGAIGDCLHCYPINRP